MPDRKDDADNSETLQDSTAEDRRQREALRLALIEAEESGISQRKVGDIIDAAKALLGRS